MLDRDKTELQSGRDPRAQPESEAQGTQDDCCTETNVQVRQVHRDTDQSSGCRGLGGEEGREEVGVHGDGGRERESKLRLGTQTHG